MNRSLFHIPNQQCAAVTGAFAFAFVLVFGLVPAAQAADVHWTNGGAGTAWITGGNWSTGATPTGADRANVSFNSGSATAPGAGVNGPVMFNTTTTVSSVRIGGFTGGGFGGAGMLQLNGGTLTVDNTGGTGTGFQLAATNNATLDGTFEMNGVGTVLNVSDGNFETAVAGTGVATINDGTLNQLTNNLIVGQNSTSNATFNMNGGLVDLQNQLRIANNAATGIYTQTGGIVNIGTTFAMSDNGGSNASDSTANISGGTLNVSDRAGGGWLIGSTNNATSSANATVSGTADVNVIRTGVRIADRGANSVGSLTLSGTATIDVNGGNTEVADNGTGTLDIQGGTYSQNTNNIIVGQEGTSDVTMTVSGGTVDIQNQLRIANRGTGLFDQSGGVVNVGTILDLANNNTADSDATAQVSGGNLNVGDRINSDLVIGNENRATSTSLVEVSGTGTLRVSDEIRVAQNGANSSGTLDIQAGLVESRSNVFVGVNGDGDLTISGGTLNVANDLTTAAPSDFSGVTNTGAVNADLFIGFNDSADGSSVAQTGGTVNVGADPGAADADLFIGRAGDASYAISAGTLNVLGTTGDIFVSDFASSTSEFNVSGTADVNLGDRLLLGQSGDGNMMMSGGTVDMGTNFIVGQDSGSDGFLDLDAGTVTMGGVMEVGQTGTGEVDQDGGLVDVNGGNINVGQNAGSTGTWAVAGSGQIDVSSNLQIGNAGTGTLTQGGTSDVNVTGDVLVGTGGTGDGTYNMDGGTLDAVNLNFGAGDGTLVQTDGTITLSGDLNSGTGNHEVEIVGSNPLLTVAGDLSMDADTSALSFVLDAAGISPIDVSGLVNLDGSISVDGSAYNTFHPFGTGIPLILNNGGGAINGTGLAGIFDNAGESSLVGATGFGQSLALSALYDPGSMTFGSGTSLALFVVPEPSRALLLAFGFGVLFLRRRR